VADEAPHVADMLRLPLPKDANETADVADVADVADLAGHGEVCGQRADGGVVPRMDKSGELLWLHLECARQGVRQLPQR
jgi:hypothetical protein